MAVDYNVLFGGLNPAQSFQQGFGTGQKLRQNQMMLQAQQQKMAQEELIQQQAMKMQNDLNTLYETPNPSSDLYTGIITKYPQFAKAFQGTIENIRSDEKKAAIGEAGQAFSLLQNGNSDAVKTLLEDRKQAAENANDAEKVAEIDSYISTLDVDPKALEMQLGFYLAENMGGEKFSNLQKVGQQERLIPSEIASRQADIDLKRASAQKARADTRRIDAEGVRIAQDANRRFAGKVPIAEQPKYEENLRKELNPLLKKNREAKQAYDQMRAILNKKGAVPGIQDVAAVVSFFKAIDPNSTVTTTETGQIQGATGLEGSIAKLWNRAISEGNFTDKARNQLKSTARDIYNPLKEEAQRVTNKYKAISNNLGLNFDNVNVLDFEDGDGRDLIGSPDDYAGTQLEAEDKLMEQNSQAIKNFNGFKLRRVN